MGVRPHPAQRLHRRVEFRVPPCTRRPACLTKAVTHPDPAEHPAPEPTSPAGEPGDAEPVTTGERIRRAAVLLSALAADGLAHSSGEYDLDRYRKMADIADELLSAVSGHDASAIRVSLGLDGGYVTPKVDVRGALFDNRERVLLIRERTDGRWSLPGGWADPGDSPARAVQREMLEESGHPVRAVKLVGCWDRGVQWHLPALSVAVYKLFFLCGRVRAGQLHTLLEHHRNRALPTLFD